MIKLKVSYENERELEQFLSLIQDNVLKVKLSMNDKGQFKKAYITMKEN